MNNTKRKMCTGVIAAVVCFAMILTSFGALIGAAFGILSNEDLINAINNGSLSLGDGVNLSNITLNGGTITNVAQDGYNAVAGSEVADKTADYNTYNAPYYETHATITALKNSFATNGYTAGVTATGVSIAGGTFDVHYGAQSTVITPGSSSANKTMTISSNTLYYLANGMRCAAASASYYTMLDVAENQHLVIAMATAEEIIAANAASTNDYTLNGSNYGAVFADDLFSNVPSGQPVYGICFNRVYINVGKNASLTILGRDFNDNGYIDDVPVQIDSDGDKVYDDEWFYEKIVFSGSTNFQDYDVDETGVDYNSFTNTKSGVEKPLIDVWGGTSASTSAQLILSGVDLRNNFNKTYRDGDASNESRDWTDDDVACGGGAIYLASGSKTGTGRKAATGGWFKNAIITNTRFSYCGSMRGGAVMVGKNFYTAGVLDFSYSDFFKCYTTYWRYGYSGSNSGYGRWATLSGDGGAICFFQDDTYIDNTRLHNNPSLIYAAMVDFTGATFTYCYAWRSGGAIQIGGYYYNKNNDPSGASPTAGTGSYNVTLDNHTEVELGTRIDKLIINDCSFYGCGAGWQIAQAPTDGTKVLEDSDFIFTTPATHTAEITTGGLFANLKDPLGISDFAVGAASAPNSALYTLTERDSTTTSTSPTAQIRWKQTYDGNSQNDSSNPWKIYGTDATYKANKAQRSWNGWLNLLDSSIYGGAMNGGAINANCRIAEMTISNSEFRYCAADNNGSVMYMDDYFACRNMTFNNCLFKNNLCTVSNREGGSVGADTGTVRGTGIACANIKMNDCSFLYNCNMGEGALYLNINNTYNYDEDNGTTNEAYQKYYVTDPGTEVNDCLFFGNFAIERGAAIYCSGIMDINSSTFAHNLTNAGAGGAITFNTYTRGGIVVSATEAQMRLDPNVGTEGYSDGNTIICNNTVGYADLNSGGGGIAVVVSHSVSVGDRDKDKITVGNISSYPYSFDFKLGGVLVFNNHSNYAGGGILYRVDDASSTAAVNAWLYNKSIELDNGYIFDNKALQYGGGVSVWDTKSLIKDASTDAVSKAIISGAHIYANEAATEGGGLYLCIKNGDIDITGGSVLANVANGAGGGGLMVKDTTTVNVSGGQIGATEYARPTLTLASTGTTFTKGTAMIPGGNKAARVAATNVDAGVGGGIYVLNEIKTSESSFIDKNITLTMTGGLVEGNIATGDGGGLYMVRPTDNTTYGKITFTMSEPGSGAAADGGSSTFGFVGNTAVQGGGIYISSGNVDSDTYRYTATINGGAVNKNVTSSYGGGMFITAKSLVQLNGGSVNENESGNNGGGIYINANSEFNMTGGQLSGNKTTAMGGGLYTYNANANVDGGSIASNTAATNGGGACVRGGAVLTVSGGNFSTNTATSGNGGGVYTDSPVSSSTGLPQDGNTTLTVHVWNNTVTIPTTTIKNDFNTFLSGLGYNTSELTIKYIESANGRSDFKTEFNKGTKIDIVIGGGPNIYFYQFNEAVGSAVDVWYGTRGAASDDTTSNNVAKEQALIKPSYAAGNASRTAAFVTSEGTDGEHFDKVSVLAKLFYAHVLTDDMPRAWKNLTEAQKAELMPKVVKSAAVTITAGNIAGNVAANGFGGGVCCENNSSVKMNATSATTYPVIDGNTAKNGGGVAVIAGSDLTMQGGYVINNKAVGTSTGKNENAYSTHLKHSSNGGVGGGIYVANEYETATLPSGDNMATFTISLTNDNNVDVNTGIYLNNAQFAADDVFANAYGTQLTVPAFNEMTVKDNAGKPTGWFEDYANGEPRYYKGLIGNESVTSAALATAVERYDTASAAGRYTYEAWITKASMEANRAVDNTSNPTHYINDENAYVCVTLGAYVVYDGNLTITKDIDGTVDTEQVFIFHVKRLLDQYGNETVDVDLFVTINGEGSVTISSLPLGTYEVTEITEWSWRYSVTKTAISATRGTVSDTSAAANDAIVEFEIIPENAETGACNDPTVTFTNELTKTPWLDGNSQKVVNTAGATAITKKEVAFANFKREETLI